MPTRQDIHRLINESIYAIEREEKTILRLVEQVAEDTKVKVGALQKGLRSVNAQLTLLPQKPETEILQHKAELKHFISELETLQRKVSNAASARLELANLLEGVLNETITPLRLREKIEIIVRKIKWNDGDVDVSRIVF